MLFVWTRSRSRTETRPQKVGNQAAPGNDGAVLVRGPLVNAACTVRTSLCTLRASRETDLSSDAARPPADEWGLGKLWGIGCVWRDSANEADQLSTVNWSLVLVSLGGNTHPAHPPGPRMAVTHGLPES